MGHAAMIAQALAVERRDMRLQLQKHETDVVPDLSKQISYFKKIIGYKLNKFFLKFRIFVCVNIKGFKIA